MAIEQAVSKLRFEPSVDRNSMLRIDPVVDEMPLKSLSLHDGSPGLCGLAIGTRDARRILEFVSFRHLPVLSCACSAYDCRVVATVQFSESQVIWAHLTDLRTGKQFPDFRFDLSEYRRAFETLQEDLNGMLFRYRFRLLRMVRDDSFPGGASVFDGILMLVAIGFLIYGRETDGLGIFVALAMGILIAARLMIRKHKDRGGQGSVWLDGPIDVPECPWHKRGPHLRLNHRESYGLRRWWPGARARRALNDSVDSMGRTKEDDQQ